MTHASLSPEPEKIRCSVLIPTYGRPESLNLVLASLLPQRDSIREILVGCAYGVNECANDTTGILAKALRMAGVWVEIHANCGPLINTKIKLARMAISPLVLLLDDDVIPGAGYFEIMKLFHKDNLGALSGTIQSPFNPQGYKDWSDRTIPNPPASNRVNLFEIKDGVLEWKEKYQVYSLEHPCTYDCDFLVGGAMFVRRSLMDYYDPKVMHLDGEGKPVNTGEEIDFSLTLREYGYQLVYDSSVIAWHLYWSTGGERVWDRRYAFANWKYILKKHGLPPITESPAVLTLVDEKGDPHG